MMDMRAGSLARSWREAPRALVGATLLWLAVPHDAAAAQLIARYTFNETTGTVRNDTAGTNTVATEGGGTGFLYNAAAVPGGPYGSLTVTPNQLGATGGQGAGTGTWQTAANNEFGALTNDFTVMAWVRFDSLASFQRIIGRTATGAGGWALGIDGSGKLLFTGFAIVDVTSTAPAVAAGTWAHVAATKSSVNGVTLFVNGEQVFNDAAQTGNWTASTDPWNLLSLGATQRMTGLVDDLRVYSGALDAEGVREALSTPVAPIGKYTFGETRGPLRLDSAGATTHASEANATGKVYNASPIPAGTGGALTIGGTTLGALGGTVVTGSGGWLTAPSTEFGALVNNFTVMAWVAPLDLASRRRIISLAPGGQRGWGFGVEAGGGLILTGYGVIDVNSAPAVQSNVWQHVAVSKSATGGVTFYRNGEVLQSVPARTEDWLPSYDRWALLGGPSGEDFYGAVDEIQVFPAALDTQAIREAAMNRTCSAPDSAISSPGVTTNDIVVGDVDLISDLDVKVDLNHAALAPLTLDLLHVESGRKATLAVQLGAGDCLSRELRTVFDDEAAESVNSQCNTNPVSINGTFRPQQPLSAFDGDSLGGTWRLSIDAAYPSGTGRLNRWCLRTQKSRVQDALFRSTFEPVCGDGVCDVGETFYDCPTECGGSTVLATTNVPVPRSDACGRADGRSCESLVGNVTTDALRVGTAAEFAIQNAGGLRASLTCPVTDNPNDFCPIAPTPPPYLVTRGQILGVLPFGNVAMSVTVTGVELKAMLENGVSRMPLGDGRFPQVSGLCMTYAISAPAGSRVVAAVRQLANGSCTGTAIDFSAGAQYVVGMNDFMAAGGDGYPNFTGRTTTFGRLDQLVSDYVTANSPLTPALQGRIACTTTGTPSCPVQ